MSRNEVVFALVMLIIGAVLSPWLELWNYWRFKRKLDLAGKWRSRYRLPYEQHPWVEEEIDITTARGKICLKSPDNPKKDHYVAYASRVSDDHLIGSWESTRPSANAKGGFMLTVHPQGHLMFGYFVGPSDGPKSFYGTWVLTRKDKPEDETAQLAYGHKLLEESSKTFKPQTNLEP